MSNPFAATSQQVAQLIQQAAVHYSRGELPTAEAILTRVLAQRAAEPDAIHLMALVRAAEGRHGDAEVLYRRSLALRPNQAEVHANLGNSLSELRRSDDAIAAYREAIRLNRDFVQAHLNLGHALYASGDRDGAERSYRNVLRLNPGSLAALQGLGGVLNDAGRADEAETVHRRALAATPGNTRQRAALEHNLGVSLKLQNRFDDALAQFDKAQAIEPALPLVESSRASVLQQVGRSDEAVASYRRALARNPLDLAAHRDLNRLLYRLGRDDEFLVSFDEAAKTVSSPALPVGKAHFLSRLERFAEARDALETAARLDAESPLIQEGLGAALSSLGDFDAAIAAFERALRSNPDGESVRTNLATALLRAGDARKARTLAEEAHNRAPLDQHSLAILSLASRAMGEDDGLNDFEHLVQVFDLEPPEGYADMAAFNRELNGFLDRFHTDKREHFDQTLRIGTQTLEPMFGKGHALVEGVRARIDEAVATYIQRMKDEPAHPLFGRRAKGFDYSGSWSSRLNDCGFHTNHIHPKGWISSCYYIALPEQVADEEGKQGWIKFGEPNFEMGLQDPVRRTVQPAPGRLVLFPSYMWHGTVPFHSGQSRTTIAFDALPR